MSDQRDRELEQLLDRLPVGIERLDTEGTIVFSNRAHHEMHGCEPGELVGRSIFDLVEGDELKAFLRRYWQELVREQPPPEPWIGVDRRQDGTTIDIRVDWAYEHDADGRLTGFVAAVSDITEELRVQSERNDIQDELDETRRQIAALMDTATDFALYRLETTADPFAGTVVFVSPSITEIMGIEDPSDFSSWFAHILPEDLDRVVEANRVASETGAPFDEVMRIRHPVKGEVRWIRAISRPVFDESGVARYFNGLLLDVTRERRAEEERQRFELNLRESQRLESLGTLAGGIAHEFNNLLVGILGSADLAGRAVPADSPARADLERIVDASQRAAELTDQLLAYSGRAAFSLELVDLNELLRRMTRIVSSVVAKKIAVELELDSTLPPVQADQGHVRQVVMNLVTNAGEAIGTHTGIVTIETRAVEIGERAHPELAAGSYAEIRVSDSGAGMDGDELERLFEPFFSTKETGRGLGMAAVRGIVERHRGSIRADSTPNEGTTISILLPAAPETAGVGAAKPANGASDALRTILVIDDEELVRTVAETMLKVDGHEVLVACDGVEGLELFAERQDDIDTVLLDMSMPRLGGVETFERLRAARPDLQVVFTTGYHEEEVVDLLATDGNVGFLQKPYRASKLRATLAALPPPARSVGPDR